MTSHSDNLERSVQAVEGANKIQDAGTVEVCFICTEPSLGLPHMESYRQSCALATSPNSSSNHALASKLCSCMCRRLKDAFIE